MNSLYRNYFVAAVAGIFCWLNTGLVLAQNATNVTCNSCISWFELDPNFRGRAIRQVGDIAQNRSDNAALEARIEELEALVATLQASSVPNLGTYLRIDESNPQRPTAWFEAVNVMVVNGTGTTAGATNGLGNLIVGYDEFLGEEDDNKNGSHNLVVGIGHNYSSFGGFVAGRDNTVSREYASVSGGNGNTASGRSSSVSGGNGNTASGQHSSVSGGAGNTASGDTSSVSGGQINTASGSASSVSGGFTRAASGQFDWRAGASFHED
jgi:hypothetical protein